MPHPAIEFLLPILAKRAAIRKVMDAVEGGEIAIPDVCELCGACPEDGITFHHMNGYDELHQYDIAWLCQSCYEDASA